MKQTSLQFCPVPLEQQPLNEYQELKQSWFFRWVTLPKFEYGSKLALIGSLSLLITAPIAAASFPPHQATIGFTMSSIFGSLLFVGGALLRLYLGWSYIGDRLNKEKIIYEESGWYDGQEWEKPVEILMRDRLIFTYEVKPMLRKLEKSGLILTGFLSSCGLILFLV